MRAHVMLPCGRWNLLSHELVDVDDMSYSALNWCAPKWAAVQQSRAINIHVVRSEVTASAKVNMVVIAGVCFCHRLSRPCESVHEYVLDGYLITIF